MEFVFPKYTLKTRKKEDQHQVWDISRKKWVVWGPEEEVRQHLLHYLLKEKNISPGLLSVEKEIKYVKLKKRFDVVVFDSNGKALIVCECKAPHIPLTQDTLYQVARYNAVLKAPHLLITNGVSLLFFSLEEDGRYGFREEGWIGGKENEE